MSIDLDPSSRDLKEGAGARFPIATRGPLRVIRYKFGSRRKSLYVWNALKADAKSGHRHLSRCAKRPMDLTNANADRLKLNGRDVAPLPTGF